MESGDNNQEGLWTTQNKIFVDLALQVCANQGAHMTHRRLIESLTEESKKFISEYSCAPDESPMDSFMEHAIEWKVIKYDHDNSTYLLGEFGTTLVNGHFEQLTD